MTPDTYLEKLARDLRDVIQTKHPQPAIWFRLTQDWPELTSAITRLLSHVNDLQANPTQPPLPPPRSAVVVIESITDLQEALISDLLETIRE